MTDIRYIEGKSNVVADALSRPHGISSVNQSEPHVFVIDMIRAGIIPDPPSISKAETSEQPATKERAVPIEKVDDFAAVVKAIGQINVNLNEMARDQALDPDFNRIANDARRKKGSNIGTSTS